MPFEPKGGHRRGNADTEYKLRFFETLENAYGCGTMTLKSAPAKSVFRLAFGERDFPAEPALALYMTAHSVNMCRRQNMAVTKH